MTTTYELVKDNEYHLLRWDTTDSDAGRVVGATIALPQSDVDALLNGTETPENFAFDANDAEELDAWYGNVTAFDNGIQHVRTWDR